MPSDVDYYCYSSLFRITHVDQLLERVKNLLGTFVEFFRGCQQLGDPLEGEWGSG